MVHRKAADMVVDMAEGGTVAGIPAVADTAAGRTGAAADTGPAAASVLRKAAADTVVG